MERKSQAFGWWDKRLSRLEIRDARTIASNRPDWCKISFLYPGGKAIGSYRKHDFPRGAAVLEADWAKTPILCEACRLLGSPLVRNRATIGGNLADASPAADLAVPFLALDAEVVIAKKNAEPRRVPIDQLFLDPNKTVLRKDELIEEIWFPKPTAGMSTVYQKLGLRNAMAISVISMAILIEIEKDICRKARIAVGAAAPVPMRAYNVEKVLTGKTITEKVVERCSSEIADEVRPISDIRASAQYRRAMARVLLGRLLRKVTTWERNEGNEAIYS